MSNFKILCRKKAVVKYWCLKIPRTVIYGKLLDTCENQHSRTITMCNLSKLIYVNELKFKV